MLSRINLPNSFHKAFGQRATLVRSMRGSMPSRAVGIVQSRKYRYLKATICMAKPWRPTIDDVDSISRGGPAKVRGTGSRRIPHRLNAEERTLYDLAKKKSFLAVRGTAYRKFRHGNPLPNIYRQWCDARGQVCVVVEQDLGGSRGTDRVVVDLAPLRWEDTRQVDLLLAELAAEAGLRRVSYLERPPDALPFNILPPDEEQDEQEQEESVSAAVSGGAATDTTGIDEVSSAVREGSSDSAGEASSSTHAAAEEPEGVAALRRAVEAQAEAVRQLKAQGLTNKDLAVQEQVRVLLQLKEDLAHLDQASKAGGQQPQPLPPSPSPAAPEASGMQQQQPDHQEEHRNQVGEQHSSQVAAEGAATAVDPAGDVLAALRRSPLEHYYRLPIWQIHAVPLFFEGSRTAAKEFASRAVQQVAEAARQGPAAAVSITSATTEAVTA